ncbi:MAG TPA: DUF202 domain-containing protein [Nitrospirae bacterium]|nr:DUF202 domain-containing protein [Nitrospirota bacterium]
MSNVKFSRLVARGIICAEELENVRKKSELLGQPLENLLIETGVPKHEILFCLSTYYNCPYIEFDEDVLISQGIMSSIDAKRLKKALWLPLSVQKTEAEVIAYDPWEKTTIEDIKKTLGVEKIDFKVALPLDLVRIIENNQDLNHGFPPSAGRTPLAKVRTYLAGQRTELSLQRTALSRGRTGLAFLRTGIAFITAAITLFRIFGTGYLIIPCLLLLAVGIASVSDGLLWYLTSRKKASQNVRPPLGEAPPGFSVLKVSVTDPHPVFSRTEPVEGAEEVRNNWSSLSPVQRRRFLANDRTDMAEERTALAILRTNMAKARTGLAFARTGIAFAGLGIGLFWKFPSGPWTVFDITLIVLGALMAIEGLYWYLPGRSAGIEGLKRITRAEKLKNIWEMVFPPSYGPRRKDHGNPPVKSSHAPGIWGTTGLALERTMLAERRNIMARLRTVMARSRTAMAFIRTGLSISVVGTLLLVLLGTTSPLWDLLDCILIATGVLLITNGILWYIPAEKIRQQFPYCFGDFEISLPDYGKPSGLWRKAVFSHDDIE